VHAITFDRHRRLALACPAPWEFGAIVIVSGNIINQTLTVLVLISRS
jgi:ABC-type sulfate transport system permease subunit